MIINMLHSCLHHFYSFHRSSICPYAHVTLYCSMPSRFSVSQRVGSKLRFDMPLCSMRPYALCSMLFRIFVHSMNQMTIHIIIK
jgi:hypothetical protein